MATELFLAPAQRGGGLVLAPYGPVDLEKMERLPATRHGALRAVITAPRHVKRNRWFHALLTIVAQAYEEDMESLKVWLKFKTGLVDYFQVDGEVFGIPKSVAFHAMDETEFAAFCDRSVAVICRDLLGGIDEGVLKRQIEEMI